MAGQWFKKLWQLTQTLTILKTLPNLLSIGMDLEESGLSKKLL